MTGLIVAFILIALAGLAGNYALDMYRHDGRAAAARVNADLRSAEEGLADLGAAEAAYIAAGQNIESANTWMNTATALAVQLESAVANLNATTTSAEARAHYTAATPLVNAVAANDRKARGLVGTGQILVAADVVLIEGADTVKQLKAELAAARDAEMAAFEAKATLLGWVGLGTNALVMVIGLLLLIVAARRNNVPAAAGLSLNSPDAAPTHPAPEHPSTSAPEHVSTSAPDPWFTPTPDLTGAADLCVDLASVQDGGALAALMSRAAAVLEAKGLVLWISEHGGTTLRPSMAHGYSERVLQRMGTLSVDGDNVTSLAFRTRQPQVVRGSVDGQGALAVPLIAASGCVGVLAAEVQGAKPGDARFAVARIIAAQLSTLVAPSASSETPRAAAQS
ncbi:MAG: hypothetical protein EPO35_07295 [Acidobacteria bacterium]|nr:MAG: hypothetical protein EPO35_07295 [Acidobacteriota bacterium]